MRYNPAIKDKFERRGGERIAELLRLKPLKGYDPVRYDTAWGNKTLIGLYRCVERIVNDQRHAFHSYTYDCKQKARKEKQCLIETSQE